MQIAFLSAREILIVSRKAKVGAIDIFFNKNSFLNHDVFTEFLQCKLITNNQHWRSVCFVIVENYLEFACSDGMPFGGRNKELAMHCLYRAQGDVKVIFFCSIFFIIIIETSEH